MVTYEACIFQALNHFRGERGGGLLVDIAFGGFVVEWYLIHGVWLGRGDVMEK